MSTDKVRVCVVGAGVTGLVAIRELVDAGFDVQAYERTDDVVGVWARVYDTVHLLTSREATSFRDYPMPESYPSFPTGEQYRQYIRWFADAADLRQYIAFNTDVVEAVPLNGGTDGWNVTLGDGTVEHFDALVAAHGHLWAPRIPSYPGAFTGTQLHTSEYHNPSDFVGDRVLVVGSGNSACDMVTDAIASGRSPMMSLRSGTWFVPQSFFGTPRGNLEFLKHTPDGTLNDFNRFLVKASIGTPSAYGFPEPEHDDWASTPPTFSTLVPYWAQRGRVRAVPEISRFDGQSVHFTDGSVEEVDTIVWATGYRAPVPFVAEGVITETAGYPSRIVGGLVSSDADNLYYSGMCSPRGGAPHNYGRGAQTIAQLVAARARIGRPLAETVFADEVPSGRMDWLLPAWVEELEAAEARLAMAVAEFADRPDELVAV
ncbi:flavin-containing monooxygenase [Microbacterium atlanticum]|uniref:flavin-containing monooxygenase n=1 Tax=Microbacterium atlanticum TaxID=2782168 RepID=UPI001E3FE9B6|nr:NAD(P)-binding domain-containing protein [Microbacterium atlanticum]